MYNSKDGQHGSLWVRFTPSKTAHCFGSYVFVSIALILPLHVHCRSEPTGRWEALYCTTFSLSSVSFGVNRPVAEDIDWPALVAPSNFTVRRRQAADSISGEILFSRIRAYEWNFYRWPNARIPMWFGPAHGLLHLAWTSELSDILQWWAGINQRMDL